MRFAVVLNGGVSLAVWMGGAVHELHRLTREAGGVYGTLLRWAMSSARVDVISGTSAGGINGAALALAQSNVADPGGTSLAGLRDVWLESGSIQNLLHPPFRGSPASLLRGDGYFLPQMNRALRTVVEPYDAGGPLDRPMDLTITTTLLRGVPGVVVDSSGQQVGQIRHDGLFRFRRGPTHPAGKYHDDFADRAVGVETGGLIDALALAARSTASFPVAFEPSYVPASGDTADKTTDALHPDMAHYLSGAWDQSQGGPMARYAVDGGVLANTPTRPAMEAIDAMPARGLVRRLLLLVVPHAPPVMRDSHDDATDPPTLVEAGSSLLTAMRSEGSRNFVDLVERHNDAAAGRREMRADVVAQYADAPAGDRERHLRDDAARVYRLYRRARLRRAARDLAQNWLTRPEPGGEAAHPQAREQPAALVPTIESVLGGDDAGNGDPADHGATPALLPSDGPPAPDQMGFAGALGIADAAVDYLKRALWWLTQSDAATDDATRVKDARDDVSEARNAILDAERTFLEDLPSAQQASSGDLPDPKPWTLRVLGRYVSAAAALRPALQRIAESVVDARISDGDDDQDPQLAGFVATLFAGEDEPSPADVLRRLGYIEILTHAVSAENTTGNSLPIELIQLTYQVKHSFAPSLMTGEDKIAGDAMARFSGFLKRSWRTNDWTWGRLDAARMLCRTVLDPDRVRRYLQAELPRDEFERASQSDAPRDDDGKEELAEQLPRLCELADEVLTLVSEDSDDRDAMRLPRRADVVAELAALLRSSTDSHPPTLDLLPDVFAAAVALEIAQDELPVLPEAIAQDIAEGAAKRSRGAVFIEGARDVFIRAGEKEAEPLERWRGLEHFSGTGLGQETPATEASSDQMISAATTAAATTVTMLDGGRSGLGAVKGLTRVLRGGALLPYWTVNGLTGGNTMARALGQLSFALGGVLLVLGLLGAAPVWATTAGIGLVLVAFVYGALRSGTILHGVVLLIPALIVLAVMLSPPTDASGDGGAATETAAAGAQDGVDATGADTIPATDAGSGDDVAAGVDIRQQGSSAIVLAALAVVAGLFILGSLRPPIVGPLQWLDTRRDNLVTWMRNTIPQMRNDTVNNIVAVVVGLVVVGVVAAAVYFVGRVPWQRVTDALARTPSAVVAGALLLAAVIGIVLARLTFSRLQTWALVATTDGSPEWKEQPALHPDASTASWSVMYGVVTAVVSVGLLVGGDDTTTRLIGLAIAVGGLLLLVVVPLWMLVRSTRRQQDRARRVFSGPALAVTETEKIEALFFAGLNYAYLITRKGGSAGSDPSKDALELTGAGEHAFAKRAA